MMMGVALAQGLIKSSGQATESVPQESEGQEEVGEGDRRRDFHTHKDG